MPATIMPRAQEGDGACRTIKVVAKRKRESGAARQAARHRHLGLHRSLRHCTVAGGRGLARQRRRLVGVRGSPCQSNGFGGSPHRISTPTARATKTTFAQLVSERLGIPIDNVSIVHGDTDKVQFGMGTYGSRAPGRSAMSAIVKALDKIEAKAKESRGLRAGSCRRRHRIQRMENSPVAGTDKSAAWGDIALNAYIAYKTHLRSATGAGTERRRVLRSDQLHLPHPASTSARSRSIRRPAPPRLSTGRRSMISPVVIINPMIVEGQVHGGIAQGVGQALCEGAVYDEDGQLVTGSFMDYAMPRADYFPKMKVGTTVTKCPSNPLGIKGCGEAGAIAAPAVESSTPSPTPSAPRPSPCRQRRRRFGPHLRRRYAIPRRARPKR